MNDQQVVIHDDDFNPPSLGWIAGFSLIMLFDIWMIKRMFNRELEFWLGIIPS